MNDRGLFMVWTILALGCVGGCSPFVPAKVQFQSPIAEAPFVLHHGLPFVEVTINGRGPFTFMLDTGSVAVILSKPLAATLALEPMNVKVRKVAADGQRVPALEVVQIDRLTCGQVSFEQFGAAVLDTSGFQQRGLAFDGILGLAPFRAYLLSLDLASQRFFVQPGRLDPQSPYTYAWAAGAQTPTAVIGFDRPPRTPGVADLVIDTGSNAGIVLPRRAEQWQFGKTPRGSVSSMSIAGETRSTIYELDVQARVGMCVIERPWVQYSDTDGSIGMGVLARLRTITIDQQQRLTQLK